MGAAEEGGKITAINIQKGRNYIDSIRTRYGDTWTPWRQCSGAGAAQEEMLELEASSEEAISSVSGYSWDSSGWTYSLSNVSGFTLSLLAATTAGRSWGPHGD